MNHDHRKLTALADMADVLSRAYQLVSNLASCDDGFKLIRAARRAWVRRMENVKPNVLSFDTVDVVI